MKNQQVIFSLSDSFSAVFKSYTCIHIQKHRLLCYDFRVLHTLLAFIRVDCIEKLLSNVKITIYECTKYFFLLH